MKPEQAVVIANARSEPWKYGELPKQLLRKGLYLANAKVILEITRSKSLWHYVVDCAMQSLASQLSLGQAVYEAKNGPHHSVCREVHIGQYYGEPRTVVVAMRLWIRKNRKHNKHNE